MHGFLSQDGMPPGDLLTAGGEEVRSCGGTVTRGAVSAVVRRSLSWLIRSSDLAWWQQNTVLRAS
jgi:hypothetical protein